MDIAARKACLTCLHRALSKYAQNSDFQRFAVHRVGIAACLKGLTDGSVDVRDGAALGLLGEAAAILVQLRTEYPEATMAAAAEFVRNSEGTAHAATWEAVLAAVQAGDAKGAKDALKALLRAKQARPPRGKATGAAATA